MHETLDERLRIRYEMMQTYTYTPNSPPPGLQSARSPRRFNPNTNIDPSNVVKEFEGTMILSEPKDTINIYREELKEAQLRVQCVKNGIPLAKVVKIGRKYHPLQSPMYVDFTKTEPVTASKLYPQCQRPNIYVFPSKALPINTAASIKNGLNFMHNFQNEENLERQNRFIDDLNERNRRREYSLVKEYKDYCKHGLDEARRRARRSATLSNLKVRRDESWWYDFVSSIKKNGKNDYVLKVIDQLSQIDGFDELNIQAFYGRAKDKTKSTSLLRKMFEKANEFGHFLPEYKLKMILDKVDKKYRKIAVTRRDSLRRPTTPLRHET